MRNYFKPDENYHRIYVCDGHIVLEEKMTVKKYEKIKAKYMNEDKKRKKRKKGFHLFASNCKCGYTFFYGY